MVSSFDDGSHEIPGGMTRPVERVLVVGAGIAGLTIANAMAHAGVECLVLEARDRVGGRLHTIDLGGSPVDLGGSWIHHPIGNPMRQIAADLGIECRPGDPMPTLAAFDVPTGTWMSPAEVKETLTRQLERFSAALPDLRSRLGPAASAADGIEAFLADTELSGDALRRTRQSLRAEVEADTAGRPEDQSLEWLWTQMEYGGDLLGVLPVGGYTSVVNAVAAGLDVRLEWPAAEVTRAGDRVSVASASGETETGSHVVVTVPLGVLKKGLPGFDPPLPPERNAAIGRLGFGRYEKVALRFARPFWRDAGWSHLTLFPAEPDLPASWIFDLDAFGAGPILACHVFHSTTARLRGASPAEAAAWLTDQLSAAMGEPCPEPVAIAVTGWADDPYTAGAYSSVPPGSTNADLDLLGTPVAGRLLFAGEHTHSARAGYADGALTSGIREAKRLLGTPAVSLGRLSG
jgi:monoamine oxidase